MLKGKVHLGSNLDMGFADTQLDTFRLGNKEDIVHLGM